MTDALALDFPDARPAKPLVADHARRSGAAAGRLPGAGAGDHARQGGAGASGIRAGFDVETPAATLPVAASVVSGFAPGSAALDEHPDETIAWARDVARDPRVQLKVAGAVDGSAADVDPAPVQARCSPPTALARSPPP